MVELRICWSGSTTGNSVTSYTLAYSPVTSSTLTYINGLSYDTTCYTISGLTYAIDYSGYVQSHCTNCYDSSNLYWSTVNDIRWIEYTHKCEKDTAFAVTHTISNLSTPFKVYYDTDFNLAYGISSDYSGTTTGGKGNIFWFDPLTATSETHFSYYTGITFNNIYNGYIDNVYKKIYLVGTDVNITTPTGRMSGLTIYDITANTHTQIAYGSNTQYLRIQLLVDDNYIYVNDSTIGSNGGFKRFNKNNLSIVNTYTANTTNKDFFVNTAHTNGGGETLLSVNDKIWVVGGSGNNSGGVGIFDNQFNLLSSIATGSSFNSSYGGASAYCGSGFYDSDYNTFYNGEPGNSVVRKIDVNPQSSGGTINTTFDMLKYKQSKLHVQTDFTYDSISNKLYMLMTRANSSGDGSTIQSMYELDRTTGAFKKMFKNVAFSDLHQITDSYGLNSLVGVNGGVGYPGSGYGSDGTLTFINNAVSGDSTGNVIVTQLEQYNFTTNTPLPGTIKDNVDGTEGYISGYTSTTVCPITTTTNCPDLTHTAYNSNLYYEIQIPSSVSHNPSISGISVSALTSTNTLIGSPQHINIPFPNNYTYYGGQFTGGFSTTYSNYKIQTQYYGFDGTPLGTVCTE